MTYYDYKVVPAPKQLKRVKGVRSTADLFCVTLAEAINGAARDGWEYLHAESLPATEEGGLFRRGAEVIETVLVFRRPRETLGPRLAARAEAAERDGPPAAPAERGPAERPQPATSRREPSFGDVAEANTLRPSPRLGPADPP